MSDTSTDAGASADQEQAPLLQFVGQYIKDLSFEVPHAPEIFQEMRQTAPDIPIAIDCTVREIKENTHEVMLNVHVEATVGDKAAFILEVTYAGIILVGDMQEDVLHPALHVEVPRQLFPFVRQIVSDTTVQGGFPPLMLQMVDFVDLYHRKHASAEAQQKADDMAKMTGGPVAGQNL